MLKLLNISNIQNITRVFENMGTGLLLLRVSVDGKDPSPYHWLLEDGNKPPFDISVEKSRGAFNYLKFFLQDDKVLSQKIDLEIKDTFNGLPIFDINVWSKNQYYVSETGIIRCFHYNENIYLVRTELTSEVKISVRLNTANSLLFTENRIFAGAIFSHVTPEEIESMSCSGVL